MIKLNNSTLLGQEAETLATNYLIEHGLGIIEKNFHSRFGEIDIIAEDKNKVLAFIEVRYRQNTTYMDVVETIDHNKCRKIIKTSQYYLSQHHAYRQHQYRYDFIGIVNNSKQQPVIEWIKNAFQA